MPQGINNSYANTLGIRKSQQNLNPGANTPPDPLKDATTQGTQYKQVVTQNLNNPGGSITAVGGRVAQDTMDNLNNPDKNRSDFGNIADENLRREAASGRLYGMDNLQAQTERANAQNASRTTTQTQEALAQQGIRPGTAGYARALGLANAGVNAQNLDRTQALNAAQVAASKDINARLGGREALAGQRYSTALGNATNFEANARNVQQGALNQAAGIEQNAQQGLQTQYQQNETARLENKTEQQALINSVQDPKVKALLQGVAAQGGDVKNAYAQLTGTTIDAQGNIQANAGTLNPNFASLDPSQTEIQGLVSELKAYNPKQPGETDQAYETRINEMKNKMGNQMLSQKYAPLDQGTKNQKAVAVSEKLNTLPKGKLLEQADFDEARKQGLIKDYTKANFPRGTGNVNKYLLDNPSGIASIDGEQVRIVAGRSPTTSFTTTGQPRHTDETEVIDSKGNTKYYYNGKMNDKPQKNLTKSDYWALPGF